jgi:hypothetical protein
MDYLPLNLYKVLHSFGKDICCTEFRYIVGDFPLNIYLPLFFLEGGGGALELPNSYPAVLALPPLPFFGRLILLNSTDCKGLSVLYGSIHSEYHWIL